MRDARASSLTFDTNIFVYAADSGAGLRYGTASQLIGRALRTGRAVLIRQTLAEFYSVVTRKRLAEPDDARAFLRELRPALPVQAACRRRSRTGGGDDRTARSGVPGRHAVGHGATSGGPLSAQRGFSRSPHAWTFVNPFDERNRQLLDRELPSVRRGFPLTQAQTVGLLESTRNRRRAHALPVDDLARLAEAAWHAGWRLVMEDEGLELSGYIAFTAFLSLFPFLIFLAALAGFLGDEETAGRFIDAMFSFMPDDVAEALAPAVREVINTRQGGLLTLGIVATLWFASNGVEALRAGLNRAYGVAEGRPVWWLRLQSLGVVVLSGLVIFFLSLAVLIGPLVWEALGPMITRVLETRLVFVTVRYLVAVVLLWTALMLLHRWLPNARQSYRSVLPGVTVTVVVWLAGASLFSWYLGNLADYSVIYGSLGGVAIALVFFYITGIIFIFGAELNAAWRRTRRLQASAQAKPQA